MLGNLLYAVGVIFLIIFILAITGVLAFSWVVALVISLICFVVGDFLTGRRRGPL